MEKPAHHHGTNGELEAEESEERHNAVLLITMRAIHVMLTSVSEEERANLQEGLDRVGLTEFLLRVLTGSAEDVVLLSLRVLTDLLEGGNSTVQARLWSEALVWQRSMADVLKARPIVTRLALCSP